MSNGKSIIVDISRCIGCRGCQVACKQWNELPATHTEQTGSYQNPPSMNGDTYKVLRFIEGKTEEKKLFWSFVSDMCHHCVDAPCAFSVDDGVIEVDEETGAVVFTDKTVIEDYDAVFGACPYGIPQKNERLGLLTKCTMCNDRIKEGLLPACVLACSTGAMLFGNRDEMLRIAEERVAKLKKTYPKAHAIYPDEVRVIFIVTDSDDVYGHLAGY